MKSVAQFLLSAFLCFCLVGAEERHPYNRSLALTLVEYASAVYDPDNEGLRLWNCSRCIGRTEGFVMKDLILDEPHNLKAYVGVTTSNEAVVAFRGTHENSLMNWVEDLTFLELDLNYPGIDHALVHKGFYSAYHNTTLRKRITGILQELADAAPGGQIPVLITGHSLGAALAALCALDVKVNLGMRAVHVVTFGQPRVGNRVFAAFYNSKLPDSIRVTHGHDMVVHLPPLVLAAGTLSYFHVSTEVWMFNVGTMRQYMVEQVCDGSGEDPTCSRSVVGDSIADHLEYFGLPFRSKHTRPHSPPHHHHRKEVALSAHMDEAKESMEVKQPSVAAAK